MPDKQVERIQMLNTHTERNGRYVLYWMQQSLRSRHNHALEYAISCANHRKLPLVVCFGLTTNFPGATLRHYHFMFEALVELEMELASRGIRLVVVEGSPADVAVELGKEAQLVVTDRGYLRIQRAWRTTAAAALGCPLHQVEGDVVVPVEKASPKEEYNAANLRKKISPMLEHFLAPVPELKLETPSRQLQIHLGAFTHAVHRPAELVGREKQLGIQPEPSPVATYAGGTAEAERLFRTFLDAKLERYDQDRSDPSLNCVSRMSAYLHFGMISPVYLAREARASGLAGAGAYIEELVVRRELAMNYAFYNDNYDRYEGLPTWAQTTLEEHRGDTRRAIYTEEQLQNAETGDPYWNAAQQELLETGSMHGYMRMYWGKKILEWRPDPREAFDIAVRLNDTYQLDGRDPNSYTGVAWCFGKHDRPWPERDVFGKVRYMNAAGLERKFKIKDYAARWSRS